MSGGDDSSAPRLHNLLNEEVAQLRGFLALLEKEQQALTDGDIERLMPLAADKTGCFARLAQLGEARARALAAAGLPANRQGMATWLDRQPEADGARRDWRDLLSLARSADALNRTNGELIATRLAHNQQALTALMTAANQAALYGPDGQSKGIGGGRSLGSV